MARFCVIASNSFTGSHFIDYILDHTDSEILGISQSQEYPQVLLPYRYKKSPPPGRFKFVQLDLNRQMDRLMSMLKDYKPTYLVNFAAQGEVRNSWNWPEEWFQTNCMAVVSLAQRLVGNDYLKKYIAISTPEVYGPTAGQILENNLYQPSTPYAASKLAGDLFLSALHKRYGFPVNFTRAANLYGIHQKMYRIIPKTIICLLTGKKITLHGMGKGRRTFVHARDVADATYKVATLGQSGDAYHISPSDAEISISDLVKKICKMMDKKFENHVEMVEENFGQDSVYNLSSEKIRNTLGWKPQVSLDAGIMEVIQWVQENLEGIKKMPFEYVHIPSSKAGGS